MKVAVWDTYVSNGNGQLMHFDIIVPSDLKDETIIYDYGRQYLSSKGVNNPQISTNECRFCHIEEVRPDWEASIKAKGFYIYEMEGCDV